MLILARKEGQAVKVGDDTWVYVVSMSPTVVKLGFRVPRTTKILREELVDDDTVRVARTVSPLLRDDDGE